MMTGFKYFCGVLHSSCFLLENSYSVSLPNMVSVFTCPFYIDDLEIRHLEETSIVCLEAMNMSFSGDSWMYLII